MPEGDALHRAAERLRPLVGERVEAESPNPRGQATGVARAIDGRVLEGVDAVGKHLLLRFEGGVVLRSHLRMNGRWRLDPRGRERRGLPWLVLRGASGRRRSGTARCSRWRRGRSRGSARISSPTTPRSRPSSRACASPTRRFSWARRSSISGSSPASGTCGLRRRSGTSRSRRGGASTRSRTPSWSTRLPGRASTCARRSAGARSPRASTGEPDGRVPAAGHR